MFASSVLSLVLVSHAGPPNPEPFGPALLNDPVSAPATSPRLAGGPDRQLIMSWLQPDGESVALRYSHYKDGRWSDAATVIENDNMFVNWADFPSVVPLGDRHLAAHWLRRSGGYR